MSHLDGHPQLEFLNLASIEGENAARATRRSPLERLQVYRLFLLADYMYKVATRECRAATTSTMWIIGEILRDPDIVGFCRSYYDPLLAQKREGRVPEGMWSFKLEPSSVLVHKNEENEREARWSFTAEPLSEFSVDPSLDEKEHMPDLAGISCPGRSLLRPMTPAESGQRTQTVSSIARTMPPEQSTLIEWKSADVFRVAYASRLRGVST